MSNNVRLPESILSGFTESKASLFSPSSLKLKLENMGWSTGRSNTSLTSMWSSRALKLTGESGSIRSLGIGTLIEIFSVSSPIQLTRSWDCGRCSRTSRLMQWIEDFVRESKMNNLRFGEWDWVSHVNLHFLGFSEHIFSVCRTRLGP